jgi:DNA polymerase elongation subunit (family B)
MDDLRVVRMDGRWDGPMQDGRLSAVVLTSVEAIGLSSLGTSASFSLDDADGLHQMLAAIEGDDPDVVLTEGGDAHLLPALRHRADAWGVTLRLGRSPSPLATPSHRTTVRSYGRLLRRGGHHRLQGRVHIDLATSFLGREAGLPGLIELSQASGRPLGAVARRSPGAVISAIQVRTAMQDGVLIPWRKNRPEDTTTGWDLLHADRGGLHLDPTPGLHFDVFELDFASLFPSIIATRNISPETLGCTCCSGRADGPLVPLDPSEAKRWFRQRLVEQRLTHTSSGRSTALAVPGLGLTTCLQQHGLLGRVVAPLILRRRELKAQRTGPRDDADRRQLALKWLLVTCFGYTGYRNARFGRIEAHEAICAWARDVMMTGIETARSQGWEVVHGIVDSLWITDVLGRSPDERSEAAERLAQRLGAITGIPLEVEGRYPVLAILPRRSDGAGALTRYWGCGVDAVKVRGIEARQHSTSAFVKRFQHDALAEIRDHVLTHEPSVNAMEALLLRAHDRARAALVAGNVPLEDLLVARRVERGIDERTVNTSLQRALRRSERLGWPVALGSRVRFVEVDDEGDGVVLATELLTDDSTRPRPDMDVHVRRLDRAAWSLLAPFGWDLEPLRRPLGQGRLPVV